MGGYKATSGQNATGQGQQGDNATRKIHVRWLGRKKDTMGTMDRTKNVQAGTKVNKDLEHEIAKNAKGANNK